MGWSFFTVAPSATRIFLISPGNGDKTFSPFAETLLTGASLGISEIVFKTGAVFSLSPTSVYCHNKITHI